MIRPLFAASFNRTALAALAVVSVLSVVFHGFEFPYSNNIFYVPIVLDVFSSAEGPHDDFHRSLGHFVSLFWPALGLVTTERNVGLVFLAAHTAARFGVLTLVWLIVRRLAPEAPGTALAAVLALPFLVGLLGVSPLGHQELFVNYLTHSEVVTCFVLLAWLLALERRWLWCAAVLGAAFNVNAFIALWAAAAAWLAMQLDGRARSLAERSRATLTMGVAFAAAAAPTAIWIARTLAATEPSVTPYDFRDFLLAFYPFHTFVHVQPERVACLAALAGVCGLLVRQRSTGAAGRAERVWIGTLAGLLAVLAFGLILPYVTGSRLLLNSYPLRMDAYVVFLLLILLCAQFAQFAKSAEGDEPCQGLLLVALLSFANGNLWLLFLGVAAALYAPESRGWRLLAIGTFAALAVHAGIYGEIAALREAKLGEALLAASLAGGAAGFGLRHRPLDALLAAIVVAVAAGAAGHVGVPLALAVLAATAAGALAPLRAGPAARHERPLAWLVAALLLAALAARSATGWLPVALAVAAAAAGRFVPAAATFVPWARFGPALAPALLVGVLGAGGVAAAARRGSLARLETPEDRAFVEASEWLRHNTPPDTVVLTPRTSERIHLHARRPAWFDWALGAAVMWEPGYYGEWSRRRREVEQLGADAPRWLDYARERRIAYVVLRLPEFPSEQLAALHFELRNDFAGVVRVPAVDSADGPPSSAAGAARE